MFPILPIQNCNKSTLKIQPLTLLLLGGLCLTPDSRAEIYQCKDSAGRIEFKDSPCRQDQSQQEKQVPLAPLNVDYGRTSPGQDFQSKRSGQENLLRNPGFANQTESWRLVDKDIYWSDSLGVAGSGALVMNAELPPVDDYIHDTKAEQCVLLDGSAEYFLSARLLLDKTPKQRSAHRANIVWYRSRDCSVWGTFGSYIEPKYSTGRQLLSSQGLKPTTDAVAAKIELVQKGEYSNQGRAIWDNINFYGKGKAMVKIAKTGSVNRPVIAGNYIRNGGFAHNLDRWGKSSNAEWSPLVRYQSSGSVRTWIRSKKLSRGTGVLDQCVLLGRADVVELGAHVKIDDYSSSRDGGGRLRLSWYDDKECRGKYQSGRKHADIQAVKGWQHLQVKDIHVPAFARSAKVELIQSISGQGVFVVNWDDVYLQ